MRIDYQPKTLNQTATHNGVTSRSQGYYFEMTSGGKEDPIADLINQMKADGIIPFDNAPIPQPRPFIDLPQTGPVPQNKPVLKENSPEEKVEDPHIICATCPKCEVITAKMLGKIWKTADIERLNKVALLLNYYINIGEIDNEYTLSHFCAQSLVETGENMGFVEKISYKTAQKNYQNNKWLGNKLDGDGYRFIGRGLLQITGRYNYNLFQSDYKKMYNEEPYDYLVSSNYVHLTVTDAVRAGLWFWTKSSNRPVRFAVDSSLNSIKNVSKKIQGSLNYLQPRKDAFEEIIWKNRIFKNVCFNKTLQNSNYLALKPVGKNVENPLPFTRSQELKHAKISEP